jgi:2-methylcitrate dehydratase PrpD
VTAEPLQSPAGPPFVGELLGQFVAASSWPAIPEPLRHQARRALLNYVACAFGSARDPALDTAVRLMRPAGERAVTVIGRRERLEPMGAAFVNAISANFLDYDDTHWNTAIHAIGTVAASVLALAEQHGLSGAEVLHALILGVEVECRIGNAVSPEHYARGMHITATCGVFGAAAGCARLLQLPAAQIWSALGIAASQSAGIIENLSTPAKNVAVGNAARNGMLAALLAQAGYTAAPAAIEGAFGWARAMGDVFHRAEITRALGEQWEFQRIAYKPYPCGFVFHAIIDAGLELRQLHHPAARDIVSVVVRGNQLLLDRGNRPVTTDRDARVSIAHAAAIALLRGRATPQEFSSDAVHDPELQALRQKVRAELTALPTGAASVTLTTGSGEETVLITHARGSLQRPLSDRELELKFHDSVARAAGNEERIRRLWALDSAHDLSALLALLTDS